MERGALEAERRNPWSPLLAALLAACAAEAPDGDRAPDPPSILLVSIDTLRADHLPFHGYERPTAPRLTRLAEAGVVFENATASSSWTLPSHLSMLTGLSVSAHGVCDDRLWTRRDAAGEPAPVPLRGTFVSEVLAAAGYRCGGFYSWKYLDDQFGFGPGFETWERLGHTFYSHPEVAPEFERLRAAGDVDGMKALAERHPELFDDTHPSSPEVVDSALAWVAEHRASHGDRPYFLFVHLFDVHDPYVPPAPYRDLFDPDYEGPIDGRRITAPDSPVRRDMDPRDLEHLIALYDGGIAWVDSEVGRLLDGIAERAPGDTLTIVTSDHGEEFFEHGHKTHRRQVYRESVHVPLVVAWPGVLPAGARVASPVGLVDLAPTLCAAARVDAPPPMEGADLVALARSDAPTSRDQAAELLVFASGELLERHLGLAFDCEYAVRITDAAGSRWQTFDLAADPRGAGPPTALEPGSERARDLDRRVDALRARVAPLRALLAARGDGLAPLDEHDLRQLAAMGYAGQDEAGEGVDDDSERGERLCVDGCVWPPPSESKD